MLDVGAIIHLHQGADPVVGLFSNQIIQQHTSTFPVLESVRALTVN
jgi:hypothetical protein